MNLPKIPLVAFPVAAVVLVAGWQYATVQANYRGNASALWCTGDANTQPPVNAAEHVYSFPHSRGYDGQFYHYVAHDPWLRTTIWVQTDDPRRRFQRILVPGLAWLLALGQSRWVDRAYECVCLGFIGLGVYWSCLFAREMGLNPAWGLLFLALPATVVTADRLVVDGALAALAAGFVCYSRRGVSWKLFAVLACAALARETGFALTAAYCAHLLWERRFGVAAVFAGSALPALAWYGYVRPRTPDFKYNGLSHIPLSSILSVAAHPAQYPAGTPFAGAVVATDYLALAGMLLAVALGLVYFARRPADPVCLAALAFAAVALTLQHADIWLHVYSYGRVYTPLALFLPVIAPRCRSVVPLLPALMMLPRLGVQLAPQALGILHWPLA